MTAGRKWGIGLGGAAVALGGVVLGGALVLGGCSGPVNEQAERELRGRIGTASVTVFPAVVRRGKATSYDAGAATRIAAELTDAKLAVAAAATDEVPAAGAWGINQARMFRESVEQFQAWLKQHPVKTQYALLPEYLGGSAGFGGVHCYIVDDQGRCADGILLNSHHAVFSRQPPRTPEDCTRILLEALKEDWKAR